MQGLVPVVAVQDMVTDESEFDKIKRNLVDLGFQNLGLKIEVAKKIALAHAKYGHVTQEMVDKFNEKLKKETRQKTGHGGYTYRCLTFTQIANYDKIPPMGVLDKLREAVNDQIFDSFEVAHIIDAVEVPDPIIFGRIQGTTDRFYIAQWDSDVKIEDIIGID